MDSKADDERVCAVIVTFERPALLRRCLEAIRAQRRRVDTILVVDNDSGDETPEVLARDFPDATTVRLARNTGGAGGFAAGMAWARSRGFEWIWVMDDDVTAESDCLEELLEVARSSGKRVIVPRRFRLGGAEAPGAAILVEDEQRLQAVEGDVVGVRYRAVDLFTFEGPLFHRSVLETAGLPNPDLFVAFDDWLYGVRINRRLGPLSAALATRAILRRQCPSRGALRRRSRIKGWLTGDPTYKILRDEQHWRTAYEHRNEQIMWHELGWGRRRFRFTAAHLGYMVLDLLQAVRRGWSWRLRLECNLRAFLLGVRAKDGAFLDPRAYRARLAARRRRPAVASPEATR